MTSPRSFRLHPFPTAAAQPGAPAEPELTGELRLLPAERPKLEFDLLLRGSLEELRLAPEAKAPVRRDELWTTTCFEFFLCAPEDSPYWEFNLSPCGDWNVYRFSSYRTGRAPEAFYADLPFRTRRSPNGLKLSLRCPLPPGLSPDHGLRAAVTAVIESRWGGLSWWALHHPAEEPDFHHRSGFTLGLDLQGAAGSAAQEFLHQPGP